MNILKNTPKKILIINIFGIGDVLFTTPVIANLKLEFPDAQIGYLCNRRAEKVLRNNEKIDKIIVYERDEFEAIRKKSKGQYFHAIKHLIRQIKAEQYDWVIDLSLTTFMGFLCFMAGIKQRIGLNYKNRGLFLTRKISFSGYEHKPVTDYYLDLLADLGVSIRGRELELDVGMKDTQWADKFLRDNNLKEPLIGMVPGGGGSWGKEAQYKQWAPEKYAKLADKLIENFSAGLILMGDKSEHVLCDKVAGLMENKAVSACGITTVHQFAALTKKCRINIVNDGGPLHIAVAAGARTASLFGPVNEKVYGPYPSQGHIVISSQISCRPCYHRFRRAECQDIDCLRSIAVEDVLRKIEKAIVS